VTDTATPLQRPIIEHEIGHALVIAGPGSGKTYTLLQRLSWLITEKKVPADDIWVLAFNRAIASSIAASIERDFPDGMRPHATTVHQFVLRQGRKHGGMTPAQDVVDAYGKVMLRHLFVQIARRMIVAHGLTENHSGKKLTYQFCESLWKNELDDLWLENIDSQDPHFVAFLHELTRLGQILQATFFNLMAKDFLDRIKTNAALRVDASKPYLVVDEFQDLNPVEHDILKEFGDHGTLIMALGDDDQAINDFRRANADLMRDFEDVLQPARYELPRDRRCPPEIMAVADEVMRGVPGRYVKPAGHASHSGKVEVHEYKNDDYELDGIAALVEQCLSAPRSDDSEIQVLILAGKTASHGGRRIEDIYQRLVLLGVDPDDIARDEDDPFDTEYGLALIGLANGIAASDRSLALFMWLMNTSRDLAFAVLGHIDTTEKRRRYTMTFAAALKELGTTNAVVKKKLEELAILSKKVSDETFTYEDLDRAVGQLKGREGVLPLLEGLWRQSADPDGERPKTKTVAQYFLESLTTRAVESESATVPRIRITSYWTCKGLEADTVIVTSADNVQFQVNDIGRRLLYVASTRAKKSLLFTFASRRTGSRAYVKGHEDRKAKFERTPLLPVSLNTIYHAPPK
jgi:superfamily I DNA/RNA helicase